MVVLFMAEPVRAPRCLLGSARSGGTRSVCSARGEGDRKAPEGFVTSMASLIGVLGTGCCQPIRGTCRLPDACFLDGLMAPGSGAPRRRRGEGPGCPATFAVLNGSCFWPGKNTHSTLRFTLPSLSGTYVLSPAQRRAYFPPAGLAGCWAELALSPSPAPRPSRGSRPQGPTSRFSGGCQGH